MRLSERHSVRVPMTPDCHELELVNRASKNKSVEQEFIQIENCVNIDSIIESLTSSDNEFLRNYLNDIVLVRCQFSGKHSDLEKG